MTCSPHQQLAPVSKLNVMQRVKNGFHIRHVPRDARDVASNCAPPRLGVPNAVKIVVLCSASSIFTITEKAPTRAFSWLKAPTSTFTFKTLLRHYAKWALTPW